MAFFTYTSYGTQPRSYSPTIVDSMEDSKDEESIGEMGSEIIRRASVSHYEPIKSDLWRNAFPMIRDPLPPLQKLPTLGQKVDSTLEIKKLKLGQKNKKKSNDQVRKVSEVVISSKKPFLCPVRPCKKSNYITREGLIRHIATKHREIEIAYKKKEFPCPVKSCRSRGFSEAKDLKRHIVFIHPEFKDSARAMAFPLQEKV